MRCYKNPSTSPCILTPAITTTTRNSVHVYKKDYGESIEGPFSMACTARKASAFCLLWRVGNFEVE